MRQKFDALGAKLSNAFALLRRLAPRRSVAMAQATGASQTASAGRLTSTSSVASRHRDSVNVVDLLGRQPVNLDTPELQRFIAGKVVLVTGAGGSIGSEICRQSMRFCPGKLVLLDQAENALFEIDRELRHRWVGADLVPTIADVTDARRIAQVFEAHRPQVVFHCAAHKHVPMMEHNPGEAIKNNVFGTKIVADAASEFSANAFVMVSTDKAVNPTSVMGATKRVAELYVQSLNRISGYQPVPHGLVARATEARTHTACLPWSCTAASRASR
jgi:FlaA1/EpsC-like NDP-sugar epimerase